MKELWITTLYNVITSPSRDVLGNFLLLQDVCQSCGNEGETVLITSIKINIKHVPEMQLDDTVVTQLT